MLNVVPDSFNMIVLKYILLKLQSFLNIVTRHERNLFSSRPADGLLQTNPHKDITVDMYLLPVLYIAKPPFSTF